MKKKKTILIIITIIIIWNVIMFIIIHHAYMSRVEKTFKLVKEDTINSKFLNEKYVKIENVKFTNFMQWTSKQNGKECVKSKVYTKENKHYKVCIIIDNQREGNSRAIGYIIDGKEYYENNN